MQPLVSDSAGDVRFKKNLIVDFLLLKGGYDMNDINDIEFPVEDREQFLQLIGYSVGGFSEITYVRAATVDLADRLAELHDAGENLLLGGGVGIPDGETTGHDARYAPTSCITERLDRIGKSAAASQVFVNQVVGFLLGIESILDRATPDNVFTAVQTCSYSEDEEDQ